MRHFYGLIVLLLAVACSNSPTSQFLENFKQEYGNIANIEQLIFEEDFASADYTSRFELGYHYYDFRSGNGFSTIPAYVDTEQAIRLKYVSTNIFPRVSGIRTKTGVIPTTFKPGSGRSIFVRFEAALDASGSGEYNKIILTLNTEGTPDSFKQEENDTTKCETEITGKGTAIVLESESTKTNIRIEKMSGVIDQLGSYSTSCSTNDYSSTPLGILSTTPEPYTGAGPFPATTWRFMTLNPGEYPTGLNDVSTINYAQVEYTSAEVSVSTLEQYQAYTVEIQPDSTVKITAFGKTTTITNFKDSAGLEFGNGYNLISIVMVQGTSLLSDSSTTKLRKLQISLGESTN